MNKISMNKISALLLAAVAFTATIHAGSLDDIKDAKANQARKATGVLRVASNVADGETVTIGTTVFEVDTSGTPAITAGNVRVDCSGGVTPALFTAALNTAINAVNTAGFPVKSEVISTGEILVTARAAGAAANAIATTETLAGTNNAWGATTLVNGSGGSAWRSIALQGRAANATEVAVGDMHFVFPFTPTSVAVQVRTAAGIPVAWVGAVTIVSGRVTVDNSGATDFAATDVVTVTASN